jgi:phosphoribosylformimino-5-aminoimidazole carboxamide ribonucleotide (ProFAR) isomerase
MNQCGLLIDEPATVDKCTQKLDFVFNSFNINVQIGGGARRAKPVAHYHLPTG